MKVNIPHVAKLANLTLTKEEENKFEKQLSEILTYIEKLNEVDTQSIEPTSQVTGLENVTRKDKVESCEITQEQAISSTSSKQNGFFKVKGILENNDK